MRAEANEQSGIPFGDSVSLEAPLLCQYRSSWFHDSSNTTRLEKVQQCGFAAAERPRENEIVILEHVMGSFTS